MDEKIIEIAMMIIMHSGNAKSSAVEAIDFAENNQFLEANNSILKAEEDYRKAGQEHFKAIQIDSEKDGLKLNVLFIHAEDQMLNAETIIILAKKFINVYKKIT